MSSRWGGTPQCPRCQKAVYMAEQVIGPNGPWHKSCLTCIDCKKRLDSFALAEHEGEAYCKTCHVRRFGPKGYGYGSGASFLNTDRPIEKLNSNDSNNSKGPIISDKLSQSPPKSPSTGFFSTQSSRSTRRTFTLPANNDICPRCSKVVYAAESALGAGVKYHKLCLRCENCDKLVSSSNLADREGKIYCRPCYSKAFGPKGYGYGNGASFLTTEGATT